MKQNFFAVDLGATSGRTILGSFIEGGLNLEEINRFPNHLIEPPGRVRPDASQLHRAGDGALQRAGLFNSNLILIENLLMRGLR